MATVAPSGGGIHAAVEKRDGGTVIKAGNIASDSPITRALGLNEIADDKGEDFGSKVVAKTGTGGSTTDSAGIAKAVSGGTLAFNASATQWIMRGGNVSTTIGGVSNDVLVSAGSDFNGAVRDNVHELLSTRAIGSGNGTFDLYAVPSTEITPNYTKGAGAGDQISYVAPSGGGIHAASDDAATPTRSVPGELTYNFGALAKPTTDEYKAKNSFES